MTMTEEKVLKIWQQIFEKDNINLDDNFFEIGGDSMKAMNIVAEVQKQLVFVNIGEFFEYQTIREIAAKIDEIIAEKDNESGGKIDG